jgi:hypothetical protein
MKERDAKIGDIIQTHNGNRYLVFSRGQLFVGNEDPSRVEDDEWLPTNPDNECKVVGKVLWR